MMVDKTRYALVFVVNPENWSNFLSASNNGLAAGQNFEFYNKDIGGNWKIASLQTAHMGADLYSFTILSFQQSKHKGLCL